MTGVTAIDQRAILALLAAELDDALGQLETLGASLCADIAVVQKHLGELQALDHASQRCAAVAAILRADDILAAVQAAPLETVHDRIAALR